MSGWDAPTGNWDSREEPEESGGPEEQGHQQEPTGAYPTAPGSEGRLRAGRRGLPGYDQAQSPDQATGYDQGSSHGSGPGYRSASGDGPETGTGQQPSFGPGAQRSIGPASGYPQGPASTGPQRAVGPQIPQIPQTPAPSNPRVPRAAIGSRPQAAVGYDETAAGGFPGFGPVGGTRPAWSGPAEQPGFGASPGYGSDRGYGGKQGHPTQQGFGTQPGYGLEGSGGEPGYRQPAPPQGGFLPGGVGQPDQSQPDQSQPDQSQPDQSQPDQSQPDQSEPNLDHETEVYPQQGFDPPDYPQNGFGQNGLGQNGLGRGPEPSAFGQGDYGRGTPTSPPVAPASGPGRLPPGGGSRPVGPPYPAQDYQTEAYPLPGSEPPTGFGEAAGQGTMAQESLSQDEYNPDAYGQNGFGPSGFGPPVAARGGFPPEGYSPERYSPEGYAQPGFEPAGAPGYGDGGFDSPGRPPGSGPSGPRPSRSGQRSPHRIGGTRMALYLAAAVVGVVVIVFLVIDLTKHSPNTPAAGSTPRTGTSTTAAAVGPTSGLGFTQAASVGTYPLNKAATTEFTAAAKNQATPSAARILARGAGRPGKAVVGIYDMTSGMSITAAGYKGIVFVGYDGTFSPSAVISLARAELKSSRMVKAGPNGGDMLCGYNTSNGSEASECMWVTKTTYGQVEFLSGTTPVKYQGASKLALQVRKAVEVQGG